LAEYVSVVRFSADSVEKVFLAAERKFLGPLMRVRARRREGPHRYPQNRPRFFVAALQSISAVKKPKIQIPRDFLSHSIFGFCNSIARIPDITGITPKVRKVSTADMRGCENRLGKLKLALA
jgi:hypothetical protein